MKRVALLILLCGCSLVVGPDVPAATGGGGTAGGSAGGSVGGGSSGGSAGGNGGGSAGGVAGGSMTDAGPPCSGSALPPLRCDVFALQTGGIPGDTWLAANNGGFLAAWADTQQHVVHLKQVTAGGVVTELATETTDAGPHAVGLAGAGAHWALLWNNDVYQPVWCASSIDAGAQIIDGGTAQPVRFAAAVSTGGAVGVVVNDFFDSAQHYAESSQGCPAQFGGRQFTGTDFPVGAAVVWRSSGTPAFVYSRTGADMNGETGEMIVYEKGGATRQNSALESLYDHVGAISDDGAWIQYAAARFDGGLVLRTVQSDLSMPIPAGIPFTSNAEGWNNTSCGPGCFATVFVDLQPDSTRRLKVHFSDNASGARGETPRDVLCQIPLNTAAGVAYFGGKLGVLVSVPSQSRVELRVCDLP